MIIEGVSGMSRVDRVINDGRAMIFFVGWKCHLVFVLFVEGNRVRDVE